MIHVIGGAVVAVGIAAVVVGWLAYLARKRRNARGGVA